MRSSQPLRLLENGALPPLSCAASPAPARRIAARYPRASLGWSARDAIQAIEAVRASAPRVPFFIYDGLVLETPSKPRFSVQRELARLEACGVPALTYHYGGEYHFLRQLVNHTLISAPRISPTQLINLAWPTGRLGLSWSVVEWTA